MELTDNKMKEIPLQSLGMLAMIELGFPVRELMSPTTYSKHRAILKAHGLDVHKKVLQRELEVHETA